MLLFFRQLHLNLLELLLKSGNLRSSCQLSMQLLNVLIQFVTLPSVLLELLLKGKVRLRLWGGLKLRWLHSRPVGDVNKLLIGYTNSKKEKKKNIGTTNLQIVQRDTKSCNCRPNEQVVTKTLVLKGTLGRQIASHLKTAESTQHDMSQNSPA
jgi:hypothetical protein